MRTESTKEEGSRRKGCVLRQMKKSRETKSSKAKD